MKPLLASLCALLASCASPYYVHKFGPNPNEATASLEDGQVGEVRSIVTFEGFRQEAPQEGRDVQAELKLRIENRTGRELWLEPRSIVLASVDPYSLGREVLLEPQPGPLAPGGVVEYAVILPLQYGKTPWDYDLRRMTLSWTVDFGDDRIRQRALFVQYDPIYDPSAEHPFPDDLLR